MTSSAVVAHTVLVVGPIPPPVHGASRITQGVLDEADRRARGGDVHIESVSTSGSVAAGGLRYHLARIRAHGHALHRLAVARRRGPVRLYLGGAGGAGLWYQLAVATAARVLGGVVTFHHHSYGVLDSAHPAMRCLVAVLGRRGTHVCLSQGMARALAEVYAPRGPILAVSNARFVPDDAPRRALVPGRLRLIHVSNLGVEKGSVRVVEAFRDLRARGVDASLVLVGPVPDGPVRDVVDAVCGDFPEHVEHLGSASREEVFAALDAADLFVFPTAYRYEAQPLVVLEALARGLPVLASARGALPELLPARWLIDDSVALAEQITDIAATDAGALARSARAAFDSSRDAGEDVVAALLEPIPVGPRRGRAHAGGGAGVG